MNSRFLKLHKALLLGAACSLLWAGAAFAAGKPFSMKVGTNDTLYVYDTAGNVVATLPTGTIGRQIDIDSYSFQVSYGRDAEGNLSVIVTPAGEHATPLFFTMNGREVNVDSTGVATMTLAASGDVRVEGGALGGVRVDGNASNAQVSASPAPLPASAAAAEAAASPAAAPAATSAGSPGAVTPDSIVALYAPAPALIPGPTNQKPDVFATPYGAEGAFDPVAPPSALPVTPDVRTNPSAVIDGATGQSINVPTNPPPTTPI
ncbi:MAG: hypothetical protein PW734_07145 [Verrucomicrobium sp.]|nr:hypothetical protein [Verrucomicrobium sp.]